MWKYIKYKFNKSFEKNILYLFIFILVGSIVGILFCSIVLFLLQKIGLLSDNNIFKVILWDTFKLFYSQSTVLNLSVTENNFYDFFFKSGVTIFGILILSSKLLVWFRNNFIYHKYL